MASIIREITIEASPDDAWDALRDWGAVHERLVPGFLLSCEIDGEDRLVTFLNGTVVRERFVGADDGARRLAWAVSGGSLGLAHYNASAQVIPDGHGQVRFAWIADVLPHDRVVPVSQLMERGLDTIKNTLEHAAPTNLRLRRYPSLSTGLESS
jgi:carbon monoxide dehydrogenase subunit G